MRERLNNNPASERVRAFRSQAFRTHPRTYLLWTNVKARRDLFCSRHPATEGVITRAFIMGCGRSGTSILGKVLSDHADVTYFFEPQGRWAMIDSRTDIWKMFFPWRSGSLLEGSDVDSRNTERFAKLFQADTRIILDKSPDHIFRIGFLLALDPCAKFVHIVRDGREVAQSIVPLAEQSFPILGRRRWNLWWGLEDAKWQFLRKVAKSRSYLSEAVDEAENDAERGLCEWLLSLNEIRLHRELLDHRLLEIRYDDLIRDTRYSLQRVAIFLEIEPSEQWLANAVAAISLPASRGDAPVTRSPELLKELARARADYEME
jgi:hypothetical protein